jgi:ParB family transcriptional regulator, chromosome partitioning protein
MARRNIFDNVMKAMDPLDADLSAPVAKFGAAKSISSSIDELARQASQLVEGQSVVEIDTGLIDASFVSDRMSEEDGSFEELVAAIRERGQDSPVLLRPSPARAGRYQIVFGHRRVRASKALSRPVRAVIKTLQDIDLVLAQGQENSARSNLSFIERVLFAQRLHDRGFARELIQSALSVDYQTLSKMLTIPKSIPAQIIDAVGAAKSVGRDRWLDLRKLLERPGQASAALKRIEEEEFKALGSEARFAALYDMLDGVKAPGAIKKAIAPRQVDSWMSPDKAVAGKIMRAGESLTIVLKSQLLKSRGLKSGAKGDHARRDFGDFVSRRLEALYAEYKAAEKPDQPGE